MSSELICPECGGVLGSESSEQGHPCTCFTNKSTGNTDFGADGQSSGDTFVEKAVVAAKVCCQCGKDLTGKKRLRDSRGYWCPECHKIDKAAHAPKGVKCADCGRIVNEAGLHDYEGRRICGSCRSELKKLKKEQRRLSPVKTNAYQQQDKRALLGLLAVFAVLLAIIILRQLKLIGH
ncbi:MAG: hypothetical protein ABSB33_11710 [Tepidisphaeraceae bacterium]|jgi:hypothetical protein